MGLIEKIFESKNKVEDCVKEKGMEAAIKEFGLQKLLELKILLQYENTELYVYDSCLVDRVYNKEGKCLGEITPLMSPYYKKLGHFFGPCENGNIILEKKSCKTGKRTYGVFDKLGNQVVGYCKYFNFSFIPNGVALQGMLDKENYNAVTVHYDGTVKTQPFIRISKDEQSGEYEIVRLEDGETKTYFANAEIVEDMIDSSTEIGTIEKGIE